MTPLPFPSFNLYHGSMSILRKLKLLILCYTHLAFPTWKKKRCYMPFLWPWYTQQGSLVYISNKIFHSVVFFNNFVYEFSFLFFAVYITKQCGKSVNISEQNFVELSPATRPRITNTTCRLNLAPFTPNSNDSGLVLTIEHIGLSSKTSGACLNNRINIYDGTEKLSKFINYFSITPPIINVSTLLRNWFFFWCVCSEYIKMIIPRLLWTFAFSDIFFFITNCNMHP